MNQSIHDGKKPPAHIQKLLDIIYDKVIAAQIGPDLAIAIMVQTPTDLCYVSNCPGPQLAEMFTEAASNIIADNVSGRQ